MFPLVLRLSPSAAEAEEAMQEGYLKAWRNAAAFDPASGDGWAWLATILRNAAIDRLRAARSRGAGRAVDLDALAEILPADGDEAALAIARADIARCLGRLEPLQRQIVLEAYYFGLSREELAERHQRPVNTIKTWLHRSLAELKACLGPD